MARAFPSRSGSSAIPHLAPSTPRPSTCCLNVMARARRRIVKAVRSGLTRKPPATRGSEPRSTANQPRNPCRGSRYEDTFGKVRSIDSNFVRKLRRAMKPFSRVLLPCVRRCKSKLSLFDTSGKRTSSRDTDRDSPIRPPLESRGGIPRVSSRPGTAFGRARHVVLSAGESVAESNCGGLVLSSAPPGKSRSRRDPPRSGRVHRPCRETPRPSRPCRPRRLVRHPRSRVCRHTRGCRR